MTPDLQHALVTLLGALVVAMPLTVRRWSKARLDFAAAEKTDAEAMAASMADLRKRLDACEDKHEAASLEIEHLRKQTAADAEIVTLLSQKAERDEAIMRGMRIEIDDLRRVVQNGGRRHA